MPGLRIEGNRLNACNMPHARTNCGLGHPTASDIYVDPVVPPMTRMARAILGSISIPAKILNYGVLPQSFDVEAGSSWIVHDTPPTVFYVPNG
jgi:hypothetical protein